LGSRVLAQHILQSPTEPSAHAQPFSFFLFHTLSGLLRPSCTAYTHCDLPCVSLIIHLVTIPTFDRLFDYPCPILLFPLPTQLSIHLHTTSEPPAGLSDLSPLRHKPMSSGSWVLDRGHGHRTCSPSISAAVG
jgi:hypothetical protein